MARHLHPGRGLGQNRMAKDDFVITVSDTGPAASSSCTGRATALRWTTSHRDTTNTRDHPRARELDRSYVERVKVT